MFLQTTDFVSMCVGQSMVLSVRHHGPVHENRAAESEQETLYGVLLLWSDICIPTGSTVPTLGGALRRRCVFLLELQITVR